MKNYQRLNTEELKKYGENLPIFHFALVDYEAAEINSMPTLSLYSAGRIEKCKYIEFDGDIYIKGHAVAYPDEVDEEDEKDCLVVFLMFKPY